MITLDLPRSMDELNKGIGNDRLYGEYLATFVKSQSEGVDVEASILESIRRFEAIQDLLSLELGHSLLINNYEQPNPIPISRGYTVPV
jgi:hypothetical protein